MIKFLISLILALVSLNQSLASGAYQDSQNNGAIVLVYHRFGEDTVPSTNIRIEQFRAQINMLKEGNFTFMALPDLVDKLNSGDTIPDKTIVFTVDDAYASIMSDGWPMLKAAGIPMTIFVSTDPVDAGTKGYLTWDQLRQLERDGVHIAHHTASHLHMVDSDIETVRSDIERANKRFQEELGFEPKIFAYPYGEYSLKLKDMLKLMGFKAAFAQYSSVIHSASDRFDLPRFPVNERYGDLERFGLISKAKPIITTDVAPSGPIVDEQSNPPIYGFTVEGDYANLSVLACYPSHLGKAATLHIIENKRVEVRFDKPFAKGRSRINCTMPAGGGRWYWLGKSFYVQGGVLD